MRGLEPVLRPQAAEEEWWGGCLGGGEGSRSPETGDGQGAAGAVGTAR